MNRTIRIGSRESKLAVAQSELILREIARRHPELDLELVTMKTTGDLILDRPLDEIGGKGLFVKELDQAMLDGRIDLAVHSLKDMPMEESDQLPIVAYSRRADPRDVLVLPQGAKTLEPGRPIGCSSLRRQLQLHPLLDCPVAGIRGNVLTRLSKLDRGEYGALVLAYAGLARLNLQTRINRIFSTAEILPAAGQGILAVQGRRGDDLSFLNELDDPSSRAAATAERAFVRRLGGGCSSPVAAYGQLDGARLLLTGLYYNEGTGRYRTETAQGDAAQAQLLGERLAQRMEAEG